MGALFFTGPIDQVLHLKYSFTTVYINTPPNNHSENTGENPIFN